MKYTLRVLDFLNILDYSKRLSLTNISLVLLVGKLLVTPNPDFAVVGSVIIAFANYAHKRSTNQGSNAETRQDDTGPSDSSK